MRFDWSSLLTWHSAFTVAVILAFSLVTIYITRTLFGRHTEQLYPDFWAFILVPLLLLLLLRGSAVGFVVLFVFFSLLVAVRALKLGRKAEHALFIGSAVLSLGLGIHTTYKSEYRRARFNAAYRGRPFPEDKTPVPPHDPMAGIPYPDAGALPEYETIANDKLNVRIPVEAGFSVSDTKSYEEFTWIILSKPSAVPTDDPTELRIRLWPRMKRTDVPPMKNYIEKTYALMDRDATFLAASLNGDARQKQRNIAYLAPDAAVIFQSYIERAHLWLGIHSRLELVSYEARGWVEMSASACEFEVLAWDEASAESAAIKKRLLDWCYAFIEANRETAPDAPATETAPKVAP